jgi:hypothetical protein
MAQVRVPSNVSSITLATSGVVAPVAGVVTCTALEATALCKAEQWGPSNSTPAFAALANGNSDMFVPSVITSITINAVVYPVTNGKISAVPPADTTIFRSGVAAGLAEFQLVTG